MTAQLERVAVVTGANRGLGLEIVRALAAEGLKVVLTARDGHAAQVAADQLIVEGFSVSAHQLDVTDAASVARAMSTIGFEHGRLDVLVNNAAVAIDRHQRASSADLERVAATMETNILGAWRCCTAAIPEMNMGGYGRIVNVTTHMSLSETLGPGSAAYRVSKAGLNTLTRVLAADLEGSGILVNAASPGQVDTRLTYGKTSRQPADAVDDFVWLATLPDDGPTGGLFHQRQSLAW